MLLLNIVQNQSITLWLMGQASCDWKFYLENSIFQRVVLWFYTDDMIVIYTAYFWHIPSHLKLLSEWSIPIRNPVFYFIILL